MLRAAQRLLPAYGEIQISVKSSDWTVPDETGWKVGGLLQWLHVFVTEKATLYLIRPSRGFDVAEEALGSDYSGDMTHDGWSVYPQFYAAQHGTCNGHLFVRCNRLLETATGGAVNFPRRIKALLQAGLAVRDARDAGRISHFKSTVFAGVLTSRLENYAARRRIPAMNGWRNSCIGIATTYFVT
jgi:hypothetical protein